tara:strand:+ start:275 stop:577 length:303 start_codon:yes stop_codon:yes gene_type:complete
MDSAKALEMDYLLCDVLKITMDTLDTIPLHIVTKMREVVEPAARDIYEEELLMDSIAFNIISVLSQEIETLKVCSDDKDSEEYKIVVRWLTKRIEGLENG